MEACSRVNLASDSRSKVLGFNYSYWLSRVELLNKLHFALPMAIQSLLSKAYVVHGSKVASIFAGCHRRPLSGEVNGLLIILSLADTGGHILIA